MTEEVKKKKLQEKGPKVWVIVLGYKNMPSWRNIGGVQPYFEDTIYCPTITSVSKKVIDSMAYASGGDPELMNFLLKDDSPEFRKMLAILMSNKYAVFKYSDKFDTTITLTLEHMECVYIQPTAVSGYPTVVAASNFIEVTAINAFITNGDVFLENEKLFLNEEPYEEEYELTYLRIDSIVGVVDDYNLAKRLKIKFGSDSCKLGSTIYTNIPKLRYLRVLEPSAVVLSRMRAVEFEKQDMLAIEGVK